MSNPKELIIQRMASREIFMKYMYQKALSKSEWKDIFTDFEDFISGVEEDAIEIFNGYGGREIEPLESYREVVLDCSYLMDISKVIEENIENIDDYINKYARNWSTDTLPVVDLSILRIAIAEIKYMFTIPGKVACNVAVELSKKYCDDDSYKYINGILGSVVSEN